MLARKFQREAVRLTEVRCAQRLCGWKFTGRLNKGNHLKVYAGEMRGRDNQRSFGFPGRRRRNFSTSNHSRLVRNRFASAAESFWSSEVAFGEVSQTLSTPASGGQSNEASSARDPLICSRY
jgi:hypothetical protein